MISAALTKLNPIHNPIRPAGNTYHGKATAMLNITSYIRNKTGPGRFNGSRIFRSKGGADEDSELDEIILGITVDVLNKIIWNILQQILPVFLLVRTTERLQDGVSV